VECGNNTSHWEVRFNDVASFEEAHMIDKTHTSINGGMCLFQLSKVAPTKLEMKVMSFWELLRPESAQCWISIMSHWWQPIPVFANFIFGIYQHDLLKDLLKKLSSNYDSCDNWISRFIQGTSSVEMTLSYAGASPCWMRKMRRKH
jgi:hypothetical protein